MTMGEKIRKLRKAREWSQEELARQLGMTRLAVSRWESGFAEANADGIASLSELFGVTADYLLTESTEPVLMTAAAKKKMYRSVTGTVFAVLGAVMLLILIIVSVIDPWTYTGETGSYSGLAGYVLSHNLQWLIVCIGLLCVVGLGLLLWSYLEKAGKKTR